MSKRFVFSKKVSIICFLLICLFLRLSYWQFERHNEKKELIKELASRLEITPESIGEVLNKNTNWENLIHRKFIVEGEFDFNNEVLLRNRRMEGLPGVHVITPLKIKNTEKYILVNRGYIPLAYAKGKNLTKINRVKKVNFVGLVKKSQKRKMFAPKDPEISKKIPKVKSWLRVNIPKIQKQLKYKLLPVWLEITNEEISNNKLVVELTKTTSGKAEILSLPLRGISAKQSLNLPVTHKAYPIPVFNTFIPPGRHFGYIFEWGFMALMTLLICIVMQFKRNK